MAFWVSRWLKPDLVYARSFIFPYLSSRAGVSTVAENHFDPEQITPEAEQLIKATLNPAFRVWVTISRYLADQYIALGVPPQKVLALPDAADLTLFQRPENLPDNPYESSRPNVAYIGHLYDYKGIPTILDAARQLADVNIHLVGGFPDDIARHQLAVQKDHITNVRFHGMKPQTELPPYLWYADALILSHTLQHPSSKWTSPLKLGEYLASGTPIVASDIPAFRALLNDDEVEFIQPDDGMALAMGIKRILNDPARVSVLNQNARIKAETLSYENRAQAILEYISSLC